MKKKVFKIIAFVVAVGLLIGVCVIANALVGNPVSKALTQKNVQTYLSENYADENYEIVKNAYDFKIGGYYVEVAVADSLDRHFIIYTNFFGNISHTTYESDVIQHGNTAERLNKSYSALCEEVLNSSSFPFELEFAFGRLNFDGDQSLTYSDTPQPVLIQSDLQTDADYDVRELGKKAGFLTIYCYDENISIERLTEILQVTKELFDKANIPFYAVDCILRPPHSADMTGYDYTGVRVYSFPYSDLYEDGLTQRVQAANDAVNQQ